MQESPLHRKKLDGTSDLICLSCFQTLRNADAHDPLDVEALHTCLFDRHSVKAVSL